MALTEEQRNPWRAIVAGSDYSLASQDWEDLLTELDSLYAEAPIAQPASAPSEQKPEYTREMGEAAERYFNSFGLGFNVRTTATFRYSKLWDAMADTAYTTPQPDYKAQRDALLEVIERQVNNYEQLAFEYWLREKCPSGDVESVDRQWKDSSDYSEFLDDTEDLRAAIASVKGGA